MFKKNLLAVTAATVLLTSGALAESTFKDYHQLTSELKADNAKKGLVATTAEVKNALKSKEWAVVDVRTAEEWDAAHIKGSSRVGRQAPEKAVANFVTDENGKMVKDNLIVVCNSASRASIEAETFRKMGFKTVKIYAIYSWLDECNPVDTIYSDHKDKKGSKVPFGEFIPTHCATKAKS